jgi:hypothetical protein
MVRSLLLELFGLLAEPQALEVNANVAVSSFSGKV